MHAASLGVTGTEVNDWQNDCNYLRYLISDLLPLRRTEMQELTQYKDLIKEGPQGAPKRKCPA